MSHDNFPWIIGAAVPRPAGCLTATSEYPTLDVVNTDIPSVAPPPPPLGGAPSVPNVLVAVTTLTVDQLEADLTRLLRVAQPNRQYTELADDGSPKIPSLVAVFLINQVGSLVGRPKLVDLSRVSKTDLGSIGGVARLVHRTLQAVSAGPLAS
jgi:hypothetical protein